MPVESPAALPGVPDGPALWAASKEAWERQRKAIDDRHQADAAVADLGYSLLVKHFGLEMATWTFSLEYDDQGGSFKSWALKLSGRWPSREAAAAPEDAAGMAWTVHLDDMNEWREPFFDGMGIDEEGQAAFDARMDAFEAEVQATFGIEGFGLDDLLAYPGQHEDSDFVAFDKATGITPSKLL